jgi:hypothetical protein
VFWPSVFSICNKEGDRPIVSADAQNHSDEPAKWDADLLSQLINGKEDFFESGEFLDEPESGELLAKMADLCPRRCDEIINRLLLSNENFDRLAFRIVHAYANNDDMEHRYFVRFNTEHVLRERAPSLVSRAKERLRADNLSHCVRYACTAIVDGYAEIPAICFSELS